MDVKDGRGLGPGCQRAAVSSASNCSARSHPRPATARACSRRRRRGRRRVRCARDRSGPKSASVRAPSASARCSGPVSPPTKSRARESRPRQTAEVEERQRARAPAASAASRSARRSSPGPHETTGARPALANEAAREVREALLAPRLLGLAGAGVQERRTAAARGEERVGLRARPAEQVARVGGAQVAGDAMPPRGARDSDPRRARASAAGVDRGSRRAPPRRARGGRSPRIRSPERPRRARHGRLPESLHVDRELRRERPHRPAQRRAMPRSVPGASGLLRQARVSATKTSAQSGFPRAVPRTAARPPSRPSAPAARASPASGSAWIRRPSGRRAIRSRMQETGGSSDDVRRRVVLGVAHDHVLPPQAATTSRSGTDASGSRCPWHGRPAGARRSGRPASPRRRRDRVHARERRHDLGALGLGRIGRPVPWRARPTRRS